MISSKKKTTVSSQLKHLVWHSNRSRNTKILTEARLSLIRISLEITEMSKLSQDHLWIKKHLSRSSFNNKASVSCKKTRYRGFVHTFLENTALELSKFISIIIPYIIMLSICVNFSIYHIQDLLQYHFFYNNEPHIYSY